MSNVEPPSVPGELKKAIERQSSSDRQLAPTSGSFECQVVASASSVPTADAVTNPLRPLTTGSVTALVVDLDTETGSDATFDLLRDVTVIGTATVTAGQKSSGVVVLDTPAAFTPSNLYRVRATTPGDGYTQATISSRWKTSLPWSTSGGLVFPGGNLKSWCASDSSTALSGTDELEGPTPAASSTHLLVLAEIAVTNGSGGPGVVEVGAIWKAGGVLLDNGGVTIRHTMDDGDTLSVTAVCVIVARTSVNLVVTSSGAVDPDVHVNITAVEVNSETGACCFPNL